MALGPNLLVTRNIDQIPGREGKADTQTGTRAGFSRAAAPDVGRDLFERLVAAVGAGGVPCSTGRFGAHMQVSSTNDGPVTFWLQVAPR